MTQPAGADVLRQGTLWTLDLDQPLPPGPIPQVLVVFMRAGPEVAQELAQAIELLLRRRKQIVRARMILLELFQNLFRCLFRIDAPRSLYERLLIFSQLRITDFQKTS